MKRRRVEESADGLVLMTSSVTSSHSADGLSLAVARISRLCVDNQSQDPVASYSGSRRKQQQHPVVSSIELAVAIYPVESFFESAVAMNTVARFVYPVASSMHPVASFGIQTQEKKKQA
ncbi:hypothetical protein F511_36993 [Dorcoceras hygrometricum]|uniref:Uncharacterized protein n=1 Tax=Dorcoceras hygrometricum TaxID=472368 RepID=A0A2Z7CHP9_9LAMI|nr:hypothetical protein F511_36993 [Dorcoceras hygrometricum]